MFIMDSKRTAISHCLLCLCWSLCLRGLLSCTLIHCLWIFRRVGKCIVTSFNVTELAQLLPENKTMELEPHYPVPTTHQFGDFMRLSFLCLGGSSIDVDMIVASLSKIG
ncbi:hypothetical protein Pelo_10474 [Pelomyxa schiedti]|nr:hypothetical protein Pelo_10474 [Pelomyxa schiedti]